MAANEYFSGSPTFPPPHQQSYQPPQQQGYNPAPPPYSPIPGQGQPHASPRPSPRPQTFGGKQDFRDPSPYRLPQQQQQVYQPQPQTNSGYRPSQHYYQPHSPTHYVPPQPQVHFALSPRMRPRTQSDSSAYSRSQPFPPQQQSYAPQQQGYQPQRQQQYPPQPQNLHPQMNTGVYPPMTGSPQQRPYDYEEDRPHRHHHHHSKSSSRSPGRRHRSHSTAKDSFLGAGAGGIIGDVLLGPGVGTLGGALIGALGGKGYADKKNRSKERRLSRDSGSGGRRTRSLSRESYERRRY